MVTLGSQLEMERCPHCGVDKPLLTRAAEFQTRITTAVSLDFGARMDAADVAA